jgi:hypothetical protein
MRHEAAAIGHKGIDCSGIGGQSSAFGTIKIIAGAVPSQPKDFWVDGPSRQIREECVYGCSAVKEVEA